MEDLVRNKLCPHFWQKKKIFVTGHSGFKGGWLSLWLQALNAEVIGFSLTPTTQPNLFTVANVGAGMTNIFGDIRDYEQLLKAITQYQPDIIIHMAAQPLVRYSYQSPIETYSINVLGTVHLLEAARQTESVKAIVNVTTDKCYENKEWFWGYRENDRLGGHDPYSSSKACAELVTSTYHNAYFRLANTVGLASARAGNVIGGGDWAQDRLIPDIVRACINHQTVTIRYPHALRPWQHVLEPLHAYLLLAQCLYESPHLYSGAWNIGPNEDDVKPVSWIVNYVNALWANNAIWHLSQTKNPHEANHLKLDCTKAKSQLGWQPRWNLKKALRKSVGWYQAHANNQAMYEMTLDQINEFMNNTPARNNNLTQILEEKI